jgi:hypothetical protein
LFHYQALKKIVKHAVRLSWWCAYSGTLTFKLCLYNSFWCHVYVCQSCQ